MTVRRASDDRLLRALWLLVGIGVVGALVASLAGVSLWLIDPADGSTTEGTLGATAAVSGLTAGVALAGAAIFAQVTNLWRSTPLWFRSLAWAVLIVAFVMGVLAVGANTGS